MSGLGFRDRGLDFVFRVCNLQVSGLFVSSPIVRICLVPPSDMFELCYIHGILRCSKVFNFMLLILSAILW